MTAEPPSSMNSLPNPRFASQMRPIFTEQMPVEQNLQEKRRLAEAARLEAIKKVKHPVTVCPWLKVGPSASHLSNLENDRHSLFPVFSSPLSQPCLNRLLSLQMMDLISTVPLHDDVQSPGHRDVLTSSGSNFKPTIPSTRCNSTNERSS